MGMILRIASSRIVGQGDIVGRSGYFSLNLSANSVMRGRLDARRTLKSLVADLRESWKRVKFLRTIIEAAPHPLEMADISRDLVTSTAGPDYYLVNMGKDVKGFWTFNLPVKNADYNKLQKNKRFKVEIIDVWAMTVTEYPVIFETTEELDYRVFDIHHRGVRIPDAPYIVLRITEVK